MREHWSALQCMMLTFMNHESWDDPIRGSKVQSLGDGNVCSSALELEEAFYSPTTQPLHLHRMRSQGLNKYNPKTIDGQRAPKSSLSTSMRTQFGCSQRPASEIRVHRQPQSACAGADWNRSEGIDPNFHRALKSRRGLGRIAPFRLVGTSYSYISSEQGSNAPKASMVRLLKHDQNSTRAIILRLTTSMFKEIITELSARLHDRRQLDAHSDTGSPSP